MNTKRIIVFAMTALLMVSMTEAQVSVRRTAKKDTQTEASKGSAAKSKTKAAKPEQAKPKAATPAKTAQPAVAKKSTPANKREQAAPGSQGKSVRQQAFDDYQKKPDEEMAWQHIVYRELDLKQDQNAPLYFPPEPADGMTSLFRVIMDAFAKGELKAYEFLDGREVFEEKYQVKPTDIFDKFQIYYQTESAKQRGGADTYRLDDSDVPSSEVLSYYIKERWEFDQKRSKYQPTILCICPVLHRSGDYSGEAVKYPMFWLKYEDLRPFLRGHMIVSQGMNKAARYTMEEFFALGQYKGEIYKDLNLHGLSLMQQYPNPDSLRMARQRLDDELHSFEDRIWVKDTEPTPTDEGKKTGRRGKSAEAQPAAQAQPAGGTQSASGNDGAQSQAQPADDELQEVPDADAVEKINRRTGAKVNPQAARAEKQARATRGKSVRRSR